MYASVQKARAMGAPPVPTSEPLRITCERCGREVLFVTIDGWPVLVEAREMLPRQPCAECARFRNQGRRRHGTCRRCGNTGWIGERLPRQGVALSGDGRARFFDGRRRVGEAIHCIHETCQATPTPRTCRRELASQTI